MDDDISCPRRSVLACALARIEERHDGCTFDSDCVAAPLEGRCTGPGCPPFPYVNASARSAFLAEAQAEIDRYCGDGGACAAANCDGGFADAGLVGRCLWGRCRAESANAREGLVCADSATASCSDACGPSERCYSQVACAQADGGRTCWRAADGGTDLCHRKCTADGGCPAGQVCVRRAFYGCTQLSGLPLGHAICCPADAGC